MAPGVAVHENPVAADPLPLQICARPRGRGEMQISNMGYEPAVYLFWPRRIDIVGAQAGLDMRHRNAMVESCQRPGKRGGRVALHDDPIGPKGTKDLAHP